MGSDVTICVTIRRWQKQRVRESGQPGGWLPAITPQLPYVCPRRDAKMDGHHRVHVDDHAAASRNTAATTSPLTRLHRRQNARQPLDPPAGPSHQEPALRLQMRQPRARRHKIETMRRPGIRGDHLSVRLARWVVNHRSEPRHVLRRRGQFAGDLHRPLGHWQRQPRWPERTPQRSRPPSI